MSYAGQSENEKCINPKIGSKLRITLLNVNATIWKFIKGGGENIKSFPTGLLGNMSLWYQTVNCKISDVRKSLK